MPGCSMPSTASAPRSTALRRSPASLPLSWRSCWRRREWRNARPRPWMCAPRSTSASIATRTAASSSRWTHPRPRPISTWRARCRTWRRASSPAGRGRTSPSWNPCSSASTPGNSAWARPASCTPPNRRNLCWISCRLSRSSGACRCRASSRAACSCSRPCDSLPRKPPSSSGGGREGSSPASRT